MWEDVGVVRVRSGHDCNVWELFNIRIKADRIWEAVRGGVSGGRREAAVLHDAAMADAALLNWVSGEFHNVVLASEEEEGSMRGGSTKE